MQLNAATSLLLESVKKESLSVKQLAEIMAGHMRTNLDDRFMLQMQIIIADLVSGGVLIRLPDDNCFE